jgi:hypothetical protein
MPSRWMHAWSASGRGAHLHVALARGLADDHAVVGGGVRADEQRAPHLQLPQRVQRRGAICGVLREVTPTVERTQAQTHNSNMSAAVPH